MAHEFPEEELLECTACGAVLPYGMMTFLEDGRILCPDCCEELEDKEEEIVEVEDEHRELNEEDVKAFASRMMDYFSLKLRQLTFVTQLPEPLQSEFIDRLKEFKDPFLEKDLVRRTDGLLIKSFNAIDFETANSERSSICSIGIVFVRDGKIVDKYYSLVRPEPDYYSYWCQRVHGLGPCDTDNAPNFRDAWNKIRSKVNNKDYPFVAHNAGFDEGCLRAAFDVYQMDYPDYQFLDTLKASRRYFGDSLPDHKLDTVALACGYDLSNHHHALADAEACARIALKIMPLADIL